ncbi:hypothetical protein ACFVX3_18420 [Rhodococcus erythropolis]
MGIFGAFSLMISLSACTSEVDQKSGIDRIPIDAVGMIMVSPMQPPIDSNLDKTTLIAFNEKGEDIGRLAGGAVENGKFISLNNRVVTASSSLISVLTESSREDTTIDENIIESLVQSPDGDNSAIWFNSGSIDGTYSTRYAVLNSDNKVHIVHIPGMALSSAFCDDVLYAVVEDLSDLSWDGPTTKRLYKIEDGQVGDPISEWRSPSGERPATPVAVCSEDGTSMASPYVSPPIGSADERYLSIVELDLVSGSRDSHKVDLLGHSWRMSTGALYSTGERNYWPTTEGAILSASIQNPEAVKIEWTLPISPMSSAISISGSEVLQVNLEGVPRLHVYDLFTGASTRDTVDLPWLEDIVGSTTESGKSLYTITDLNLLN